MGGEGGDGWTRHHLLLMTFSISCISHLHSLSQRHLETRCRLETQEHVNRAHLLLPHVVLCYFMLNLWFQYFSPLSHISVSDCPNLDFVPSIFVWLPVGRERRTRGMNNGGGEKEAASRCRRFRGEIIYSARMETCEVIILLFLIISSASCFHR